MKTALCFVFISFLFNNLGVAQHQLQSPHAGMQNRAIASLSDKDIAAIEAGTGWGLALPAEINGAPGPRHVLDLAEELQLTNEQVAKITTIFDDMKTSALVVGKEFIAAEKALNDAFVDGAPSPAELASLVEQSGEVRARLRLVHLSAHLKTPPILSKEQIKKYSEIRGYTEHPCTTVPVGHNPDLWRAHNGCG